MNKMEILLQQFKIEQDVQEMKQASINKVVVNKNGQYTFYIDSSSLLPIDEVRLLFSAKKVFPYDCNFIFDTDNSYSEKDILDYSSFIFDGLKKRYPQLDLINQNQLSFKENTLFIEVLNDIQLGQIQDMYRIFDKYFNRFGIKIGYKAYIDQNNDDYKLLQEEMDTINEVHIDASLLKSVESFETSTDFGNNKPYKSFKKEYFSTPINEIDSTLRDVCIQGYVFKEETIQVRSGKHIQTLYVTDYTDSIIVKRFEDKNRNTVEELGKLKKGGKWIRVKGTLEYDNYAKELTIMTRDIEIIPTEKERIDSAEMKRVELHAHSNMSTLDGISTVSDYISQAAKWGHSAIAVTDHGNVQSFPEAQTASRKNKIKMIYGVELNMVDVDFTVVRNDKDIPLNDLTFVSFDLETTGLSQIDDFITEFGGVKIKNGLEVGRLQSFIRSPKPISAKITELTSITNEDIKNAPTIEEFMPQLLEFFGDDLLVAHNGVFDIGFINIALERMGKEKLKNTWVDSLPLAKLLMPLSRSYNLGACCRYYKIPYDGESAHRADYDAEVLGHAFSNMVQDLIKQDVININMINSIEKEDGHKYFYPYHMCVLTKNKDGLKNLFKIVSEANTTYFYQSDRIPRERLELFREGLLFGSGCLNGKLFDLAATRPENELRKEMQFYDYVEIQPLEDAYYMVDRGRYESLDDIKKLYERIIRIAKEENKLICATGDVHFLNKRDKVFRDVFISNPKLQIGGRPHALLDRSNPKAYTPYQYFRTTNEMLDAFPYLTREETIEYVITNPNKIADMVDDSFNVVHDKLYPPHIENADKKLSELCYQTAYKQYGNPLPEIVEKRLDKELGNIIKHGFAVIYYISHMLVKESNDAGYLVGSRGSVGSSFVATMSGISEVNPLQPHYYCPHCQYSEFLEEGEIANGFDLPDKVCPKCGKPLKGDGHNIPFETFLGFNADKVPDIDLNFSGEYQPTAHAFTKKIFGDTHVYRAGTISTVAEKTAYGYAKAYAERIGVDTTIRGAELERIAFGCTGVKRTTGQHPGGIIVIPDDMEVYDFTPYQYPADDVNAEWKTTHFDFHAIHDNVLKFDILGHVDPTVIRMLQDLTKVDPKDIPTNDQRVMSLFNSSKELGIDLSYLNCKTGALGLPEFGTKFVRGMLEQTHPTCFNDLVIISGLSHGTDVYLGNAETLIKTGTCTLQDVIGCRDDIMVYLIEKGLPNKDAFDIMECVRKGKSPAVFPEKHYEELMKKYEVPQWYIDSCKKIKYMFPKAHAAAYVLSAVRVAWWKLYYPREYYAVYFSTRCDFFDIDTLVSGRDAIYNKYQALNQARNEMKLSNKEEGLIVMFEIALEMYDRGYHFNKINLLKSEATHFCCDPDDEFGILPPFTSIDGLGDSVAVSVTKAREEKGFLSKEDVMKRTKLSNTHIDILSQMGVFDDMSERNQLSLFDL